MLQMRLVLALAGLCCCVLPAAAIHNGLGAKPSMAWRSWNFYAERITQQLMEATMLGMTSRRNSVDGVPTSLLDLGYSMVGLDDAWQECGSYGPEKHDCLRAQPGPQGRVVPQQLYLSGQGERTSGPGLNTVAPT
jgi:hypothetical protein